MLCSTKKIIPRSILKSIKVCESSQLSRDTLRLNHQNLYFHIRTTSYLLLITAMNKYGWSDQSKIFKFRTLSSGTNIQLEYNYISWIISWNIIHFRSYRVSQKKQGLVFRAHFRGLNDLKIIKVEENRPHLKLLGGVFRPVCRL